MHYVVIATLLAEPLFENCKTSTQDLKIIYEIRAAFKTAAG